jgi:hypothetical protein
MLVAVRPLHRRSAVGRLALHSVPRRGTFRGPAGARVALATTHHATAAGSLDPGRGLRNLLQWAFRLESLVGTILTVGGCGTRSEGASSGSEPRWRLTDPSIRAPRAGPLVCAGKLITAHSAVGTASEMTRWPMQLRRSRTRRIHSWPPKQRDSSSVKACKRSRSVRAFVRQH